MKYWVLRVAGEDDSVFLSSLPGEGPDDWEYDEGISLQDRHPKENESAMYYDPSYPDGIKLYDFVPNLDDVLIADNKLKDVLESLGIENIEYLPIWLMDHNNQLVSKEYSILNVLGGVDIIDMEKSEYVMGRVDKKQIKSLRNLVVDYEKIPEDAKIFRASMKKNAFIIRDDVKEAFEKAGLTGYYTTPAEGWNGRR